MTEHMKNEEELRGQAEQVMVTSWFSYYTPAVDRDC